MYKRIFDVIFSFLGLFLFSPFLILLSVVVYIQDFHNPFYLGKRVGKNKRIFHLIKLRSMVVSAEKLGGDSTAEDDNRITKIGSFIRRFKIDEIPQLINVFKGDMSFVGPRPQTIDGVDDYTKLEEKLLTVNPGITDFSSIVFSDEGNILLGEKDPAVAYNQLIRPWKSRLSILYIDKNSLLLDIKLILLTLLAIFSKEKAIKKLIKTLQSLEAEDELIHVASRQESLKPSKILGT